MKNKPGPYQITVNGIKAVSINDYVDQLEDKYRKLLTENERLREALENVPCNCAYGGGEDNRHTRRCSEVVAKQALAETEGE